MRRSKLTSLELCAGAGGQALGIENAHFDHIALVEIDEHCCKTLALNRPQWIGRIHQADLKTFDATPYRGVDLLAGGLPCPPFSKAGRQLGEMDERYLFPDALRIIEECGPRAVMIENVRGILDDIFKPFRDQFQQALADKGYVSAFHLINASDFGVPQLRPRVVFVALPFEAWKHFVPPNSRKKSPTVGQVLYPLMSSSGWRGAERWRDLANDIAPTIVGGSKKHGGPDLGPTRAKQAWRALHVNGHKLADAAPTQGFSGMPNLTVPMVGLLQGFPPDWKFFGKKTHAYRQVGNAFPPPVAAAFANKIARALRAAEREQQLKFEEVA